MDVEQLRRLKPELTMFLDRYAPLFRRSENSEHARSFVQGLLAGGERRNVENIAEAMEGNTVRTLQKFIAQGCWKDRHVLGEMRSHVVEILGDEDGVLNADETGFPKKGVKSVGVKRQYSGTLGRVDNCQVGVFLNYVSRRGHTLLDRRLFLPEEWASDPDRRAQAGVPAGVVFRTKPELALAMIIEAAVEKVPFRWVGGDSVYGDSPTFVQGVRAIGKWYVVDTSSDARVWTKEPSRRPVGKVHGRTGRPRKNPTALQKPWTVVEAAAALPASAWKRVQVAEGSQGPRFYDYAEMTVWFSEEGDPAEQPERLLVRRSVEQEPELKYQRSNAPASMPLAKLAAVAGTRWTIEQGFQAAKEECGLDEYETRGWVGWHHHTALSLLALFFLGLQRRRVGEKTPRNDRARSARGIATPSGRADMGRDRNHRVVSMATAAKPRGKSMSRGTKEARPACTQ